VSGEVRVAIEAIRVEGRHRSELGDIAALAEDIKTNGLIHAIALTLDNRLIAGERRLRALQLLGETTVPVRYLENINEVADIFRAERSENTQRKDMLPSELASLGAALAELEKPKAAARKSQAAGQPRGAKGASVSPHPGMLSELVDGKASELIGDALGISQASYERLSAVHAVSTDDSQSPEERERAQKALDEMDRTNTVKPVYERWRAGEAIEPPEPATKQKRARNRKALPDAFRETSYQMTKAVERLERLVLDDRFPRNAEQVARTSRGDLLRAADLLAAVISRVPTLNTEVTE